jgi:hypothetical protein
MDQGSQVDMDNTPQVLDLSLAACSFCFYITNHCIFAPTKKLGRNTPWLHARFDHWEKMCGAYFQLLSFSSTDVLLQVRIPGRWINWMPLLSVAVLVAITLTKTFETGADHTIMAGFPIQFCQSMIHAESCATDRIGRLDGICSAREQDLEEGNLFGHDFGWLYASCQKGV